jgi:GST-like protein
VLDSQLAKGQWLSGDTFSIADIATFPWVRNLIGYYGAGELVGVDDFRNVTRSLEAFLARPAVAKGLQIPRRA